MNSEFSELKDILYGYIGQKALNKDAWSTNKDFGRFYFGEYYTYPDARGVIDEYDESLVELIRKSEKGTSD